MPDSAEKEILEKEKQILETEEKILREEKTLGASLKRRVLIERLIAASIVIAAAIGAYWWLVINQQIYTDKAEISAPLIGLSPDTPGVLKEVLANAGDKVDKNQPVAHIDNGYLMTQTAGLVVNTSNEVGKIFSPGQPVVTMIDPNALRVVAKIDEDKGFSDVRIGQRAEFTVDAFGSRRFEGTVDEIAKTSEQSSVVFSISDKREIKQFEVKIKYDVSKYPELLNGMSARVWIYKG